MAKQEEGVLLGFLIETAPALLKRHLFPSKAGGKPAWLNPRDIPTAEATSCSQCEDRPMLFLLQLYAADFEDPKAFHRTLYVFCCERCGAAKVWRSQLPQANEYYGFDPCDDEAPVPPDAVNLCDVCGSRGSKQCGHCQRVNYCSRQHQVHHWHRGGHKDACEGATTASLHTSATDIPLLEREIAIEEEDLSQPPPISKGDAQVKRLMEKFEKDGHEVGGEDSDAEAPDWEAEEETKQDATFLAFQERIAYEPSQVVRYCRQEHVTPLWISDQGQLPTQDIPDCPHCGKARQFEFQVLPQLLYYLHVQKRPVPLDFGTLIVYTCPSNCGDGTTAYMPEFIFSQAAPSDEATEESSTGTPGTSQDKQKDKET